MIRPDPTDRSAKWPIPTLSLRRLLFYIGLCGVLFAAVKYLGIYTVCLLGLGVLSILAHFAAATVGNRMRRLGDQVHDLPEDPLVGHGTKESAAKPLYAPTTKLHHKRSLGLPVAILTLLGVVGGAALPWLLQRQGMFATSTRAEMWTGSVAFAMLVGLATFLSVSFLWVMMGAWWQATRDSGR